MGNIWNWKGFKHNSQIASTKVSQVLAMQDCWHTSDPQFQGSPKTTHAPLSLLLQSVKWRHKKKAFYPLGNEGFALIIGANFLLFMVTFRLAKPYSIKLHYLRYLCVALEETSGLLLCPDKTCRLGAIFSWNIHLQEIWPLRTGAEPKNLKPAV